MPFHGPCCLLLSWYLFPSLHEKLCSWGQRSGIPPKDRQSTTSLHLPFVLPGASPWKERLHTRAHRAGLYSRPLLPGCVLFPSPPPSLPPPSLPPPPSFYPGVGAPWWQHEKETGCCCAGITLPTMRKPTDEEEWGYTPGDLTAFSLRSGGGENALHTSRKEGSSRDGACRHPRVAHKCGALLASPLLPQANGFCI